MLFRSMAGIKTQHVPYKGAGQALVDLIGGQVQFYLVTSAAFVPHAKNPRLRAIAVTGTARMAALPDVPTFAEAGLPGLDATTYRGLLAPAGTPTEAITKLNAEFNKALAHAPLRTRLAELGYDAAGGTVDEYAKLVRSEISKWEGVIRKAGIRIE